MANDPETPGQWVDERLRTLESSTSIRPDIAHARARLRALEGTPPARSPRLWLGAAAALVLVALVLPWPRAAAQRLWDRLILGRVQIVRVERAALPDSVTRVFEMREREPFQFEPVADLAQAEQVAGFRAWLPAPDVLKGPPEIAVIRRVTLATEPLNVPEITEALTTAGVSDVTLRPEWNGTTLTVEGGPVIVARYPEAGVEVMQTPPLRMTMPSGFRFDQFMEVAFRAFGRNAAEARDLARRFAANPGLLMVLRPGHQAVVREIALPMGPVAIMGEPDGGMCVFWSRPDRLFIVSSSKMDETLAAAVASSIGARAGS